MAVWRKKEEETYPVRDFAVERASEESVVFLHSLPLFLPLPPSLHLSLSLFASMCVGVCVSRLSQLRSCSLPPQMSWEEERKRMYLARGKREEFGSTCDTNQRLCSSTALSLSISVSVSLSHTHTDTNTDSQTHTLLCWLDVFSLG